MATMSSEGCRLQRHGGAHDLMVKIYDRVRLRNGATGVVYNWTADGVAVVLDRGAGRHELDGLRIWAVEAGDGDIAEVL